MWLQSLDRPASEEISSNLHSLAGDKENKLCDWANAPDNTLKDRTCLCTKTNREDNQQLVLFICKAICAEEAESLAEILDGEVWVRLTVELTEGAGNERLFILQYFS